MDKYKIYCETDNKYERVIAEAEPTECPINDQHTLRSNSAVIIEVDVQEDELTAKELTLPQYKRLRHNAINRRTRELINDGFTYDSKTFSCSDIAQMNWNVLKDNKAEFAFPKDISTKPNGRYSMTQPNVDGFWTAMNDHIQGHLDSGRTLNKSIKDAADEAAVDAIEDTR